MKKTNRSQSSFRVCKTLQSEEDENVSQSIASKKAMKPPLPKVGSSLIDHNKENYSMFQSVSERCLAATEDDNKLAEIDQEAIICRLQNQCRHY